MKTCFIAILMVFIASQAMACDESLEKKGSRFIEYDINKDGYVDSEEVSSGLIIFSLHSIIDIDRIPFG